ncbi:MAG: hypothetical protein IJ555_10395 [Ruminococcus sp.]|nr:hypothetical protein [Ruminococcus sp.]
MERDGIETEKKAVGVENRYHIHSVKKSNIQTAWGGRDMVIKNPNVNRDERIRQLHDIKHRKDYFKSRRLKLSRKKYTVAKREDESPNSIMSVENTVSSAQGLIQTGGAIRTAVGGTRNTVGRIQTAVKSGVRVGSVKDVGKIAGSIGTVAKNATVGAVKEAGHSLLKTKIDKSTTTDTGTEAIKQGLTEVRYVDNTRKVVSNTVQGSIKTARSIKETPKAVGRDVQKIREKIIRRHRAKQAAKAKKAGKAAGQAAKKTASVIGKAVTSKGFIVIALGGGLVLLVVTLLSGFVSMIVSAISSMFSWLLPGDNSVSQAEYLQSLVNNVTLVETEMQDDIEDEQLDEYTPEYRISDGSEITELNQYGDMTLDFADDNAVLAAAAVLAFSDGQTTVSNDYIKEAGQAFYTFEHYTYHDYCYWYNCHHQDDIYYTIANGDFEIISDTYNESTGLHAIRFAKSYDPSWRIGATWVEVRFGIEGEDLYGSCAPVPDTDYSWTVTFNVEDEYYGGIDWNDIRLKTSYDYCNNPNHTYYCGEVVNLEVEDALANLNFNDEQMSMYSMYYSIISEGGL